LTRVGTSVAGAACTLKLTAAAMAKISGLIVMRFIEEILV
jgi:hypothetical protein